MAAAIKRVILGLVTHPLTYNAQINKDRHRTKRQENSPEQLWFMWPHRNNHGDSLRLLFWSCHKWVVARQPCPLSCYYSDRHANPLLTFWIARRTDPIFTTACLSTHKKTKKAGASVMHDSWKKKTRRAPPCSVPAAASPREQSLEDLPIAGGLLRGGYDKSSTVAYGNECAEFLRALASAPTKK